MFDLEESPVFNTLVINGRLSLAVNIPEIHIKSRSIWVRAGEFFIGSEDEPF